MDLENQPATTQRFVEALHTLERDGDTDALSSMTAADAEIISIDGHGVRRGPDGMAALFSQYRAQFDRLETEFTQVTGTDERAALEWRTEGTLSDGRAVTYTGVTVIDLAGDELSGVRVCYDSAALLAPTPAATRTDA